MVNERFDEAIEAMTGAIKAGIENQADPKRLALLALKALLEAGFVPLKSIKDLGSVA